MATKTRRKKERQRGKRRENRHERRQQQHQGGGEWSAIRVPEGLEVFKPEAKTTYHIDVIPYIVGDYNQNADKGDEYFELSFPVYRNIGVEDKTYIAIGELCGVKDPVAEHFAALRKQGVEWDEMKMFKPTWRQLMLVFVHEQADKGLQLFEGAYGTFGELLDEELSGEEDDWIDNFDDPDHGATLVVRFKAKSIGQKNPWVLASKINFEEREEGFDADGDAKLAEEVLAKAATICLDDCLKVPDYDTLKAALDGEPLSDTGDDDDDDDEPEEKPKRGGRKAKTKPAADPDPDDDDDWDDDDDDDEPEEKPKARATKGKGKPQPTAEELGIVRGGDVEHDEYGECVVLRVAKDGRTVTIMDDEENVYKNIDPVDLQPMDAEDEEDSSDPPKKSSKNATPAAKKDGAAKRGGASRAGTTSRSKKAAEPDEDDDEDDDEPEEKPKRGKGKKATKKAPEPDDDDDDEWDDDWEDD